MCYWAIFLCCKISKFWASDLAIWSQYVWVVEGIPNDNVTCLYAFILELCATVHLGPSTSPASANGVVDEPCGALSILLRLAQTPTLLVVPHLLGILDAQSTIVAVGAAALAEVVVIHLKHGAELRQIDDHAFHVQLGAWHQRTLTNLVFICLDSVALLMFK